MNSTTAQQNKMEHADDETFVFVYDVRVYKEMTFKQFKEDDGDVRVWEKMIAQGKKDLTNHYHLLEDYGTGIDVDHDDIEQVVDETKQRFWGIVAEAEEEVDQEQEDEKDDLRNDVVELLEEIKDQMVDKKLSNEKVMKMIEQLKKMME